MATQAQVVAAIKKVGLGGQNENVVKSVPAVAKLLNEDLSGSLIAEIYDGEAIAYPELKVKPTEAGIKAARNAGLRFERISARSGLSVTEVKELAEKAGVGADFYTGRGRKPGNGNGASASAKPKATSGRRGKKAEAETPKAGTSGRRGRKTAAAKPTAEKKVGRRGTRAAANPK